MPMPKPGKDESQEDFVKRFMSDEVMLKEYPEEKQRYAICLQQWREKQKNMELEAETIDLNDVPIFAAGTWNGDTYTEKDLDEIVTSFEQIGKELKPYLKLGHDEKQSLLQKDGYPSAGWVTGLKRKGVQLLADFKQIPKKIGNLIQSKGYGRVSSEIFINLKHDNKTYPKALRAVALLGGDTPAVTSLDDFINLYTENCDIIKFYDYKEQDMDSEQIKKFEMKIQEQENEIKKYELQIKEKDTQIGEMKKTIDEYKENEVKAFEKEVDSFLEGVVKEAKITPAQKESLKLMSSDATKFEQVKKFVADQPKIAEFSEQSRKTEMEKNKDEDSKAKELDGKVKKYAKENDMSYSEAYRIVANEGGAE